MKMLIVGAGVTGCFTAVRLMQRGVDVSVLARGDKAARLEQEDLRMRDGMTGEQARVRLNIVRAPVTDVFDVVMVCVQAQHRPSLTSFLRELPGAPTVWYLGNTTQGYDLATDQLGRARVLGGFPGVGGTWEGETLVYADREKPDANPFDRLIIGEAHSDASPAADSVQGYLQRVGMKIERYVPIMDWHWSHIVMILPLASAVYRHDQDLDAVVADRALMRQTMRATAQGFAAIRRAGHRVLPRGLNVMRWIPAGLGAGRIAALLQSEFGQLALAAHAVTARAEMRGFATDLLALSGANAGPDLQDLLDAI